MSTKEQFETWAVVEIMGHQQFAGFVSEQPLGGSSFVRVDVPECQERPAFTKIFGAGSIYCITPCTEEVAREAARRFYSRPLTFLALPAPSREHQHELYGEDDYEEP